MRSPPPKQQTTRRRDGEGSDTGPIIVSADADEVPTPPRGHSVKASGERHLLAKAACARLCPSPRGDRWRAGARAFPSNRFLFSSRRTAVAAVAAVDAHGASSGVGGGRGARASSSRARGPPPQTFAVPSSQIRVIYHYTFTCDIASFSILPPLRAITLRHIIESSRSSEFLAGARDHRNRSADLRVKRWCVVDCTAYILGRTAAARRVRARSLGCRTRASEGARASLRRRDHRRRHLHGNRSERARAPLSPRPHALHPVQALTVPHPRRVAPPVCVSGAKHSVQCEARVTSINGKQWPATSPGAGNRFRRDPANRRRRHHRCRRHKYVFALCYIVLDLPGPPPP